jgi:hypothetical protein
MSGERSALLDAVGVSLTWTPPTVRSMTLTDAARSGDLATTGCLRSARVRKSRADMAHGYVGGVSPPAIWKLGLGMTGRSVWPPPRRWVCASANEGTDRAGCGRSPAAAHGGGCTRTLECVGPADGIVNRSDRRPLSPLYSRSGRARRLKMGPGDEPPSSARACGIFRCSRSRGFSVLSRLALGQESRRIALMEKLKIAKQTQLRQTWIAISLVAALP